MFSRIAARYDLANDVLSAGIHRRWRRAAVRLGQIPAGARVLDLCTGTGDQSAILAEAVGRQGLVIGLDFVLPMLRIAAKKYVSLAAVDLTDNTAEKRVGATDRASIAFVNGDALALPFADQTFDVATISFGIRNVDNPLNCLVEINRVLRPGGRLIVLEFGRPELIGLRELYRLYGKWVMPNLGGFLTRDRSAYEYLPRTAAAFPDAFDFLELMRRANFKCLRFKRFMSGIAFAYFAERA